MIFSESGGGLRSGNNASQNTFKNTPEMIYIYVLSGYVLLCSVHVLLCLDMFCDIIGNSTSKYRPDFFGTFPISGPD